MTKKCAVISVQFIDQETNELSAPRMWQTDWLPDHELDQEVVEQIHASVEQICQEHGLSFSYPKW